MAELKEFTSQLNRIPFGEKMAVTIEPIGSRNSGVTLIGELVRNPHGFAFLETMPGEMLPSKTVKKTATKSAAARSKKVR